MIALVQFKAFLAVFNALFTHIFNKTKKLDSFQIRSEGVRRCYMNKTGISSSNENANYSSFIRL